MKRGTEQVGTRGSTSASIRDVFGSNLGKETACRQAIAELVP
jgi:hypothetical protein